MEAKWEVLPNGCWEWRRAKLHGYGYVRDREKGHNVRAHRWTYERFRGSIPAGLQLDHLCRNKSCVNPDHLEAVTSRVNTFRAPTITRRNAEQTHCKRGHLFDDANTYVFRGHRHCRTCRRARLRV